MGGDIIADSRATSPGIRTGPLRSAAGLPIAIQRRSERADRDRPNETVPAPYKAANSSGSNLGPTSQALIDRDKDDAEKLKEKSRN